MSEVFNIDPIFLSVYTSVSDDTTSINHLFLAFLIAGGLVFLGVIVSTVYIIIRFHRRKNPNPSRSEGHRKFEISVAVTAVLLVTGFSVASVITMSDIHPVKDYKNPDLVIIGHQWWWEVSYPEQDVLAANEIHIPSGKRLLAKVTSADVIHDWWVPSLGRKMDLIPGVYNYVYIEAKKPGTYEGICSEFCGQQHAWMRIKVIAEDQKNFEQWITQQKQAAQNPASPIAAKGKELFENRSCGSCHRIKGTKAEKTIGPDLTHIASRSTLLSGMEKYSYENLHRWIANPQQVKPGAKMPNFILKPEEVKAITAYLNELK